MAILPGSRSAIEILQFYNANLGPKNTDYWNVYQYSTRCSLVRPWLRSDRHKGQKASSWRQGIAKKLKVSVEKGLGAMHAIAHAVGGLQKIPHGRVIAAVMPYVLKFNRRAIHHKIVTLARSIDLPQHSFNGFLDWIVALRSELGMPISLRAVGVRKPDIPQIVRAALADDNISTNPISMTEGKMTKLLHDAISGRV